MSESLELMKIREAAEALKEAAEVNRKLLEALCREAGLDPADVLAPQLRVKITP